MFGDTEEGRYSIVMVKCEEGWFQFCCLQNAFFDYEGVVKGW